MKKVHGNNVKHIECINPRLNKYRVRWGFEPHYNDKNEEDGVQYYEYEFVYKPTLDEIKQIVLSGYNKIIDEKIVQTFVWKDIPVWLSKENQFNYKAAFDLASTFGTNLPTTFKFGTTENPIYYTFETVEDLTDFYLNAMNHISNCLAEGWLLKDNIDWLEYKI